MNFTESVYELSENLMDNPQYVFMDIDIIQNVASEMVKTGKPKFPMPDIDDEYRAAVLELVAASINYCYWYGRHDVRPNGSSSTAMYNLLLKAFEGYLDPTRRTSFAESIELFISHLALERFPLLEDRARHLRQLKEYGEDFTIGVVSDPDNIDMHFPHLIASFPGFASDLFLKRASLYFIQLFRRFGWFAEDLQNLHVPADYQVPKMLNYVGCISYSDDLHYAIENHILLPKHSQYECEIRAATVLTIKLLCEITGWNVAEVDGYFFTKRHDAQNPFHLTITTDY